MLSFVIRIGFVCLLFVASSAGAQTLQHQLRGITEAQIFIQVVDHDGEACGITEDGIKSAVMFPISSSDLIIVEDSFTIIYISATVLSIPYAGCTVSYKIQMYTNQYIELIITETTILGRIELWAKSGIAYSNESNISKHINDLLETLTKELITDWNLDNK